MKNQISFLNSYSYRKNKAFLPNHRSLVLYILAYFQGNLMNVDPFQLMNKLDMKEEAFLSFLKNLASTFLNCIFEFSKSLAYKQYGGY